MKENALKAKLKRGEPVYGTLTPIYDPAIVEIVGLLGFDFYMLDCEHGAAGPVQMEHVVRACEGVGITPLARVRSTDPKLLLQFMDSAVMGIMMPGITGPADVERLVAAIKYPPAGMRGIGPVRANDYLVGKMPQSEYIELANRETLVLPQIEVASVLEQLDDLVRVQGVDGFIVGPRDLSMSMGFRDGPAHPEVRSTIEHVFKVVTGAGLWVGITAGTRDEARTWVDLGARIILGSVTHLLKLGAASFLG